MKNKNKKPLEELPEEIKQYLLPMLDDLIKDIASLSDFKIIDICRQDKCWKGYEIGKEIPKNKIIKEYVGENKGVDYVNSKS